MNATGREVQRVVTDSEGKRLAWTATTSVGKTRREQHVFKRWNMRTHENSKYNSKT